jgi:hypothetical protein
MSTIKAVIGEYIERTPRTHCADKLHCSAMEELLFHAGPDRKGFNAVNVIDIKNGEMRYIGVRYCATSKRSDKGVMLNFCPFCGQAIQWWKE